MNNITLDGRLTEKPRVMGEGENKWGLVKFAHDEGQDAKGNARPASYRTVLCSARNAQYLIDMGWDQGDQIFVEGSERIETNIKDGVTYTNVVIYNSRVSCGLRKGDTLAKNNPNQQQAAPGEAVPQSAPQQTQATPPQQAPVNNASEPRSMAELDEAFDEEEMEL